MVAKVILNPYAGRWKALKRRAEAEQALESAGVAYDLVETNGPGHALELAQQADREGFRPVVAAGGDGTIGEILNGLFAAQPTGTLGPLGIMPLGTANDLVHNLGLPLDLPSAAQAIAGGRTKRIDVGTVNGWLFANNSAVGLEPVVSIHNMRMKWARGVFRYLLAALRAIAEKPSWHMDLTWDDGNDDGPTSLVSVGNCPLTGGLFRMAPAADPTDGKLTFTYGFAATRRKMLTLLPRAISGDFVNDAAITQLHTTHLRIECREPSPLQVDGEVRETAGEIFEYEVLPQRLAVLAL